MKIKTITDEEILELILAGRIKVKYANRRNPVIIKDGRVATPYIVPGGRCSNLPRYVVKIYLPKKSKRHRKPRRRSIVRSKLVWMVTERRLVPPGHELHHKDEDRLNDRAKNIVDWTEEKHRRYHNGHDEEVPF